MSDEAAANTPGNATEELIAEPAAPLPAEIPKSRPSRWRRRVMLVSGLVAVLAAGVVLPPLVNIGRYQRQVAALVSRSLGRPVHLSSVELRLLPTPGFVLHDLSVGEDPRFGAEPVLSARTVVASVRLTSLWRGKMEISRISVDEASLNLVRTPEGRWNLESLMLGAEPALTSAGSAAKPAHPVRFPYLEATDSRVNLKNGLEKSPYSIVNTDLSLWQDDPGEWRVRLSGQPARTDIEMSQADSGEVRMEATLHTAAQLHDMPIRLQVDWREAQLGQLSRLLTGSDAGWRGDVTADIDVQGTLDSAQTKARLRATGVRREEFAPETPLDFDANCSFRYQHSQNAFHNIGCDTAIGDGRLHLKAELPGAPGQPEAMLEVKQLPLQGILDLLRTVRGGFAPEMTARGTATGTLTYKASPSASLQQISAPQPRSAGSKRGKGQQAPANPDQPSANLQGSLAIEGGILKGGELKDPLVLPAIALAPVQLSRPSYDPSPDSGHDSASAGLAGLEARFTLPLGPVPASPSQTTAAQSIQIRLGIGAQGYEAAITGSASPAKLRELAYAFGLPHLDAADAFTGGAADLDLQASGPWIATSEPPALSDLNASPQTASASEAASDSLSGVLRIRHTQWKAPYLASPVDLTQATATISPASILLTSDFSYGSVKEPARESDRNTVKGSAEVRLARNCKAADCDPQVALHFGALNGNTLQAALLGTPAETNLLSPILNRMRSEDRPKLPQIALTLEAETLELGPASLRKPLLHLRLKEDEIQVESWEAGLLAGAARGTGSFAWGEGSAVRPKYTVEGEFAGVSPAALNSLLSNSANGAWTGGPIQGSGSIELSGLTDKDLAASATGSVKFIWPRGALTTASGEAARFDNWSGEFTIKGGKAQLGQNAMLTGKQKTVATGAIAFGGPVQFSVPEPESHSARTASQPRAKPTLQ